MKSRINPVLAHKRFLYVLLALLLAAVIAFFVADVGVRNASQNLSTESSRIDHAALTALGAKQLRSDYLGGGLWYKISHCFASTGTECEPYQNSYFAVPVEPGKESIVFDKLAAAVGYEGLTQQACDLQAVGTCSVKLHKGKFWLDVYIEPQDGTLSDKDIAPRVWRQVYLHLSY